MVVALDTFYSAELGRDEVAICYLGDFAFFVRTPDQVVLINPGEEIGTRDIYAIKKLDILLITGKHGNHYETTRHIYEKTDSTIITNREVYNELIDFIPAGKLRAISSDGTLTISNTTVAAINSNPYTDDSLTFIISIYGTSFFYGSDINYEEDFSKFLIDISDYTHNVDVAVVSTEGVSGEITSRHVLDMIKTLGPETIITIHGSPDEQNALKNLLDKEIPNLSVLIPEELWVYKIVVK